MKRVFADSYYFFALLNKNEPHHSKARDFAASFRGQLVTTSWILTELGDGMASPRWRSSFDELYEELVASAGIKLFGFSNELFSAGMQLYRSRPDKSWSVTDCISFVVMQQENV